MGAAVVDPGHAHEYLTLGLILWLSSGGLGLLSLALFLVLFFGAWRAVRRAQEAEFPGLC